MPDITILGTVVNFPNTAASPVWSEAIIQFAELVEVALTGVISTGDIPKQSFTLDSSHNPASNVVLTGLSFSSTAVRAAFIRYSIFRSTDTNSAAEAGEMTIIFNNDNPSNSKWEVQREYTGDGFTTFTVDDAGQFSFSNTAIAGANHSGFIKFVAQALEQ